jgi:hypothetical protein
MLAFMGRVRVGAIAIAIVGMIGCSDRKGPPDEDGGVDAGVLDGGSFDGAVDAGRDADTFDASEDSGSDADVRDDDAGTDAGGDAGEDAQVVGESCGSDSECGAGYCDFPDDACGGGEVGVCGTPADVCPLDCPGVCGCDGRFYCNTCLAHANSIDVTADDRSCRADSCRPMDARGMGACDLAFGFAWNGVRCATVSGCSCVGDECGALYDRSEACELAYDGCADEPAPGATCGTIAGLVCNREEFCDYDPSCTIPDAAGTCRPRPEVCSGIFDPVCGCDGRTYGNACNAASAGIDVASMGACGGELPSE